MSPEWPLTGTASPTIMAVASRRHPEKIPDEHRQLRRGSPPGGEPILRRTVLIFLPVRV
jgi:hypothetical protein